MAGMIGFRVCLLSVLAASIATAQTPAHPWAMAVHGGAGESEWEHMDPAIARAYHKSLAQALSAGTAVLDHGGAALDAVEAALKVLEDDPLFNAGRGSAFAADGRNEMDAAIMDGSTLAAGSVAGVHFTRHPISLARAVMEHTPYVMMVGEGADEFSRKQGLEQEPPAFFFTAMRWQEFAEIMRKSGRAVPPRPAGAPPAPQSRLTPTPRHELLCPSLRHHRRRRARPRRQHRRRHLHRRHAGQAARPRRRLAHHRRGHLCRERLLRRLRHRRRRVLHPPHTRPAGLHPGRARQHPAAGRRHHAPRRTAET